MLSILTTLQRMLQEDERKQRKKKKEQESQEVSNPFGFGAGLGGMLVMAAPAPAPAADKEDEDDGVAIDCAARSLEQTLSNKIALYILIRVRISFVVVQLCVRRPASAAFSCQMPRTGRGEGARTSRPLAAAWFHARRTKRKQELANQNASVVNSSSEAMRNAAVAEVEQKLEI